MIGSKTGLWLALAGLVFSLTAQGQESTSTIQVETPKTSEKRKITGDWSILLGGSSMQEGKDTSEGSYFFFSPNFNFQLLPQFRIKVSPWARFYSSRTQERFGDDKGGFVFLNDAYGAYEPASWFEARVGIISQRDLQNSMLVSNYASFPGAQVAFKAKGQDVEGRIVGQRMIPTSHSDNTERDRSEPLPTFTTLHAEIKGKSWDRLEWKASGGYFDWNNMPSKVVYESRRNGNVGVGELAPGSRFLYEHKGFFGGAEVCWCFGKQSSWGLVGEFKRIHNTAAPSDSADAQLLGLGPKVRFNGMELDARYRTFFIESDATVAYYNRSRFGHTNRIGDNIELNLKFVEHKFSIYFEAFRARPLNVDPNQRNLELYFFGVETDDVSFF